MALGNEVANEMKRGGEQQNHFVYMILIFSPCAVAAKKTEHITATTTVEKTTCHKKRQITHTGRTIEMCLAYIGT